QRTVTESDIVSFCSLSGDWHPLHSDVEYAGKTVFGERIAHGWLVLSLGVSLAFRLGENIFLPKSFIANYGVDNLRFTKPVKIGDTIRGEWEVTDLSIKDQNRGILTYRYQVKNQRDEVVADMILKTLCGRRGSTA
ncbi:MAG: MaoC family dehydratase N-terminal domain-containing protein, partial [Chloroflexi bacterium]|nr:MaoC family dehydratase N-terminal domain-containing protein [Chloroflexota bacterium]